MVVILAITWSWSTRFSLTVGYSSLVMDLIWFFRNVFILLVCVWFTYTKPAWRLSLRSLGKGGSGINFVILSPSTRLFCGNRKFCIKKQHKETHLQIFDDDFSCAVLTLCGFLLLTDSFCVEGISEASNRMSCASSLSAGSRSCSGTPKRVKKENDSCKYSS